MDVEDQQPTNATDARREPPTTRFDRTLWALVVVAVLPVLVSIGWAATHGYTPTGDRSLIALNASRVLSTHPPSVGMPSTMPVELDGREVFANHLGPAEFAALAVPDRLFGGRPIGVLIGVGLVNVASAGLAVVAADRLMSRVATAWFATACAALGLGLGAPLLWDDWNPHISLLPLVLLLVAAAATVAGHRRWLPVAAAAASFVAQVHLSTVLVGLVLGGWALFGGLGLDRARGGPGVWRRWRTSLLATGAVIAVGWSPPAANQLFGPQGNVALILRSFGQEGARNGFGYAADMATRAFTIPPLWLQRIGSVFDMARIGALDRVVALGVLGALAAVTVDAVRQRAVDPGRAALLVTSWVAVAASIVTLAISPAPPVGISFVRWLWPVSMVAWFSLGLGAAAPVGRALAGSVGGAAADRDGSGLSADPAVARTSIGASVAIGLVAVVAILARPTTPRPDAMDDWRSLATVSDQVVDAVDGRSVHVDFEGPDALLAGGPELWRRLDASSATVWVPAGYTGGTSGVWAIDPDDHPALWVRLVGVREGTFAPSRAPVRVLGIGLDGRAEADRWVSMANDALGHLDGAERSTLFDPAVLARAASGSSPRSPIPADDAASLLDGLERAVYVAYEIGPPT